MMFARWHRLCSARVHNSCGGVILVTIFLLSVSAPAEQNQALVPRGSLLEETSRFIFHSVLEGLYEDGVSNEDVNQILLKKEGQSYFHFIYACPICTATIWAVEAYRARPEHLYSIKSGASTFGPGLAEP